MPPKKEVENGSQELQELSCIYHTNTLVINTSRHASPNELPPTLSLLVETKQPKIQNLKPENQTKINKPKEPNKPEKNPLKKIKNYK